ncbi:MAG: nucleotide exchange factor GrpE [Idiomarina sp.]|nr:nucleotide exchange factor GrpE [Idiomarina sp.]
MNQPENQEPEVNAAEHAAEHDETTSAEVEATPEESGSQEQNSELRIAELEASLLAAKAELAAEKDKALRVAAEAENVRRRSAQEVEKARNFALEKFAGELLSVIDNLERALQAIDHNDEALASIAEGIEMTYKGFLSTTAKFGIEAINPEGSPFDPQHHQAMGMQESDEVAPNTVLYVMQKGYLLNGRLLRPAMVMVSRAPTAGVDTEA